MASGSYHMQACNTSALIMNQGAGTVHVAGDVIVNPRSQTESPDFSLPRLVPSFRGRDDELAELERLFFRDKAKKVAIWGLPGMGKSELAKQFANRCEEKKLVEHVFWVSAENEETLKKSSIFLKELYQNYRNSKCLFLFDNTVNRKSIFEVEPRNANHLLLITSQVGDWKRDVKPLGLRQLKPDCVIEVFRVILDEFFNDRDRDLYLTIAEIVNNIPLGLQVTAAYMYQRMEGTGRYFDLQEYVDEIKTYAYIDSKIPTDMANAYEKSLYGAIEISIDKIKNEENCQIRELALNALFVCAYLNPDWITLNDLLLISNMLTEGNKNENMLRQALSLINKYSFFNFNPNYPDINMHRLVQEILRRHLRECDPGMQAACYGACLQALIKDTEIIYTHDIILKFSGENIITFINFYRKQNPNDKTLRYILECLIKWNCRDALENVLDVIPADNLINYNSKFKLLHRAAYYNNVGVMKLLVDFHFDINNRSSSEDTPLHTAARCWSFEAIRFIVKQEADIYARDMLGETPLFVFFNNAPRGEHIVSDDVREVLGLLNFQQQIQTRNDLGDSLLHAVARRYNLGLMKLLVLEHKFNINCRNNRHETPLYIAAESWHLDLIQFLTQHNADVNATDCRGETPLFQFTSISFRLKHFKLEEVKAVFSLLDCQHNANRTNGSGDTLLHAAAGAGNADMVTLLVTHYNLDVNAQDNVHRHTPLHALISYNWSWTPRYAAIRCVKALRRCGAQLNLTDRRGRTPRQLAEEHEGTKYLVPYLTESESEYEIASEHETASEYDTASYN